jgi:glycosyltransferase involved in cell wall biosynthesis
MTDRYLSENTTTRLPGVSVIIPLYNKKYTVARAIDSALAQEGIPVEIIAVDDGSSDGSDAVVHAFGDRVRLVRQQNAGPSAARNHGARLATKPLLVFLDADDELLPGCLAAHAYTRQIAPETQLSITSFRVMNGDTMAREEYVDERLKEAKRLDDIRLSSQFNVAIVTNVAAAAICVNKDFFAGLGGFDESLRCWEITDFMYRAVLDAGAVALPHGIRVVIHNNEGNSQFARTHQDLEHKIYFTHRLLDRIDRVPHDQRTILLRSVKETMHSALFSDQLSELRLLAQRTWRYRRDYPELTKLCMAAALPPAVMRTLLLLRTKLVALTKP